MSLLEINNLTVKYGQMTALRDLSLKLGRGDTVFITGPNGAGKSSLLTAIAGLTPAFSGNIRFDKVDVTSSTPEHIARMGFSMVPEGRHVFASLTIEENLKVGASLFNKGQRDNFNLACVYKEFPILSERRHTLAGLLSGGQQQMLVIGRALMTNARLIAIDEPSLGLAPKVTDQVYEILLRLRDQLGLTLLIVEQNSTRAELVGGRMILLRGGEIKLQGDARELGESDALNKAYFGYGD
jgi:branched-chain amino acid transport system ATP-binding protein